jgi:hypothetical protein
LRADVDGVEGDGVLYPGLGDHPAEEEIDEYVSFKDLVWGIKDDDDDKDKVLASSEPWTGTYHEGTMKDVSGLNTVLSVFLHLWPLNVWTSIVVETNAYAKDCLEHNWYPSPRSWVHLTVGELLVWHGLCLSMSIGRYAGPIKHCWTGRKVGGVQWPDFREHMTLFRFEHIKQYLHLRNNTGRPPMNSREGRLWQVEWLEMHLNKYSKDLWNPTRKVTIDEKGFPSRHKYCPVRVYNPTKPHKFSILQQAMCDAQGYIWHTWIYDRVKRVGLKAYVIGMLLDTLPNTGFKVYFDRWYGSTLCCQLSKRRHQNATMTMPSTYIPAELRAHTKANMTQGESHFVYCEDPPMCVTVWKDRNRVVYASTHERPYGGIVLRLQPDHTRAAVLSPEMGVEYNAARPFVDGVDARALGTGSMEMSITCHKWWMAAYFGLFDCTTCRLETICHAIGLTDSRLDVTLQLADQLLHNKIDAPIAGGTRGNITEEEEGVRNRSRFSGTHQPAQRKVIKGVGAARSEVVKQGYCVVCRAHNYGKSVTVPAKEGRPAYTRKPDGSKVTYWCELCGVHLCLGECFNTYHAKLIEHEDFGPRRLSKNARI